MPNLRNKESILKASRERHRTHTKLNAQESPQTSQHKH
jgi:hypothetical protein